ncbi:hypothetical protein ACP3V3_20845 [Vibrio sp. PNB22_3_1]
MATYMGVRGLGLTGSVAFGFAITMAILTLLSSNWMLKGNRYKNTYFNILVITVFSFSSLSAGRTAILGVFFVVLYFIYMNVNRPLVILRNFFALVLCSFLFYVLFITLFGVDSVIFDILVYYSKYVFQSIYNYIDTGSFSVSSVEHLVNKMYFVPKGDVIFGDGRYLQENGKYYMDTDAGFMRFVLLFGSVGSFYLYFSFLVIFIVFFFNSSRTYDTFVLMFLVFIMSFVFHYKGEVILYNVAYMKVVFIFVLYEVLHKKFIENSVRVVKGEQC